MALRRTQIAWCDPVAAFAPLRDEPYALLLHGPGTRWSYICAFPSRVLTVSEATGAGWEAQMQTAGAPFDRPEDAPPFCGGWAGLLCYEFGRALLPRLGDKPVRTNWPDLALGFYEEFIVFDHTRKVAEHWDRRGGGLLLPRMGSQPLPEPGAPLSVSPPAARMPAGEFERRIAGAVAYVRAGDCFQVNLSQRFDFVLAEGRHPFDVFRKLSRSSAAPFSAYYRQPGLALVSNSPEQFLEVRPGPGGALSARTRPIKGTRPRGATPTEDRQLAEDLISSEKDRAENLMIVDLMRNDLARVSQPGSVEVPDLFRIESYANVHHLVSDVTAELRSGAGALDLIRSAFPGGSVTGAPKIRAMQIIASLEDEARGPYCGSLVWITPDGWMDSSILIRSAALEDCGEGHWRGHFRAGGGIVADSDPARERQETLDKASAMIRALSDSEETAIPDICYIGSRRQETAAISPNDRSFLLGDGCFETLRFAGGRLEGTAEHLALLRKSAMVLGISGFPDEGELKPALHELTQGFKGTATVRITLSRGAGGRGGDARTVEPVTVLSLSALGETRPYPPMHVVTSTIPRNDASPLSRIKATSYGDNLAARRLANRDGADEALMLNLSGRPACFAMGNLFMRTMSGKWVTPHEDEGVRAGYMRGRVIDQLAADGVMVEIRAIDRQELTLPGTSLFGTNSLWGLRAVASLDRKALTLTPFPERLVSPAG